MLHQNCLDKLKLYKKNAIFSKKFRRKNIEILPTVKKHFENSNFNNFAEEKNNLLKKYPQHIQKIEDKKQ